MSDGTTGGAALARLTQAERLLAESASIDEVSTIVDLAEAARVYAKQVKLGTASINHATKVKIRAEFRLAELVDEGQAAGQIADNKGSVNPGNKGIGGPNTLGDIGLKAHQVSEARLLRNTYTAEDIEAIVLDATEKDKEVSRTELLKAARKQKAKRDYLNRQAEWDATANSQGELYDLRHGDFREVLADIEPGSIDAIVTDPPYPDEFLPLWGDLAALAAKLLRPGAPLIAWSGQYRLQQVLNHLCGPLTYQWTICLDMPESNDRFRGPNFIQTWKPIIVATNDKWGPHDWFVDRVVSPKKNQELYEWQQHPQPAAELISRYVPEGGLVLDPFMGVGSFGEAALSVKRRFIGVEIDDERFTESTHRIGGGA